MVNLINSFANPAKDMLILRLGESLFSNTVCEGACAHAKKLGLCATVYDFEQGTKDFSSILLSTKDRGADCILCCGKMQDDINLARWILENKDVSLRVTATLAAATNEFKKQLGPRCELFVSTSQWEPYLEIDVHFGPSSQEFVHDFAHAYGYVPDYAAAQAYNMGLLVSEFVRRTSSKNDEILMREALNSEFTTFYGAFRMDPQTLRQNGHRMLVTQWQKGEKKIVFPKEFSNSVFSVG